MAKIKVDKLDAEYIRHLLKGLKKKLDEINEYLETHSWVEIPELKKRELEFKFQSDLFDKYIGWLNKYSELSGLIEFYDEYTKSKNEKLRKGFKTNAYAELIKKGEV